MKYIWKLVGWEHEKVGREPKPVGIGAHLEKNCRTRGLARGNPQQDAQAHQGSRPGRRRGVEVDGYSDLVARRHHLHWRILQECREAYLPQGRVSEGSGPSLQLESRRKRTPRDRHPRRRRSRRVRFQGARSPSGRPQQFWQVETFEESEVLRDRRSLDRPREMTERLRRPARRLTGASLNLLEGFGVSCRHRKAAPLASHLLLSERLSCSERRRP